MRRNVAALVAVLLLLVALPLGGCKERTVTVKQGEIVICTAGEVISDDTEELQVPAADVAKYSVTTRVITCDRHSDLGLLYEEAQRLLAAGDVTGAREKLATVVERNPSYGKAKQQLDEIDAGKTPAEDKNPPAGGVPSGETTAPGGDTGEEVIGPVASLLPYVPDQIQGYSAQEIIVDPTVLTRLYLPVSKDADQLVIAAEQVVDADAATLAIDAVKDTYPDNGATVQLGGGVKGYFGTQGQFAVVAFSKGAVVVTVELHGAKGDGVVLKNVVVAVATAITQ